MRIRRYTDANGRRCYWHPKSNSVIAVDPKTPNRPVLYPGFCRSIYIFTTRQKAARELRYARHTLKGLETT